MLPAGLPPSVAPWKAWTVESVAACDAASSATPADSYNYLIRLRY